MSSNQETMERVKAMIQDGDLAAMSAAILELASDDFVQEWPQSGERIVGREGVVKLNEGYAAATGTMPRMSFKRMLGSGDVYVVEGTIDYGDGTPVSYVGIFELRDGKVTKMTDYFANPFPAPEWRAGLVERIEPVGV